MSIEAGNMTSKNSSSFRRRGASVAAFAGTLAGDPILAVDRALIEDPVGRRRS